MLGGANIAKAAADTPSQNMENKSKCKVCEKAFSQKQDLIDHLKSQHSDKYSIIYKRVECERCGSKWMTKAHLKVHMATYHSEKSEDRRRRAKTLPYTADPYHPNNYSADQYEGKEEYFKLVRKNHKCSTCGKRFVTPSHLKDHMGGCGSRKSEERRRKTIAR